VNQECFFCLLPNLFKKFYNKLFILLFLKTAKILIILIISVAAYINANTDWPDQFTFQTYISNTHPEWCLRWQDFADAEKEGLHITGSTDAPFNDSPCDYSPFRVIYQAVTRNGYIDRVHADWELAQRLTIEDCLRLLTIDGAYATFEENKKGSITPGKWADLVIVSKNPLEISAYEELLDIKILVTMVGGKIEYCDDTLADLCTQREIFIIDSAIVTASKFISDQRPDLAFDNNVNTAWGSGDYAPQWIQIKLNKEIKISRIDLVIDQWPSGETVHQIWAKGDGPADEFELIHEFNQNTEIDQVLSYTAPDVLPYYQYLRILTAQSPSWISWKEIRIFDSNTTAVNLNNSNISGYYSLMQNYPNPFNPGTVIKYSIQNPGLVQLKVYDVLGREVSTLINEIKYAGNYEAVFDGSNLPSGIYLYRLEAGNYSAVKKLLLLK